MFNLEYFANDNYKVLKFLYNNQIQVKDEYYIVLSQQEIADMVQFSKLKSNGIFDSSKTFTLVCSLSLLPL